MVGLDWSQSYENYCFKFNVYLLCSVKSWCLSTARVGLMHIGVFILLLLSGERNFGVRLNKPYSVRVPMDIPVFTGTHADFLIIVSGSLLAAVYLLSVELVTKCCCSVPSHEWKSCVKFWCAAVAVGKNYTTQKSPIKKHEALVYNGSTILQMM